MPYIGRRVRQRIGVAGLDALHQFEVSRGSRFEWRGGGARSHARLCGSDALLAFASVEEVSFEGSMRDKNDRQEGDRALIP